MSLVVSDSVSLPGLLLMSYVDMINNALDLSNVYSPSRLGQESRPAITLFHLFTKLYLSNTKHVLSENRGMVDSDWSSSYLSGDQLEYACLIAWTTYACFEKEIERVNKAEVFNLNDVKDSLDWLGKSVAARLVVKSTQPSSYNSSFSSITRSSDSSYLVKNRDFRDKLEAKSALEITLFDGRKIMGRVIKALHGKERSIKLDENVEAELIETIRVVDRAVSRAADEYSM